VNNRGLSEEQAAQAVYAFAAEQMKSGISPHQVRAMLVQQGFAQDHATTVVSTLSRLRSKATYEAGMENMFRGAFYCIAGIVVTAVTYAIAPGGYYIVMAGFIFFGAIQFLRGVWQAVGGYLGQIN
jgi:hypothetical protein